MIQSGTDLADFLPKRLAWGIVIVVLLGFTIFALPHMKFGTASKELNLADRNRYMQMQGLPRAVILQKLGPPSVNSDNEMMYELSKPAPESGQFEILLIEFDASDRCQKFAVIKAVI